MRLRSVLLVVPIALVSSFATWQWASAQSQAQAVEQRLYNGFDIGFIPDRKQEGGIAGERFVRGQVYVRIDGRWVPVAFTPNGAGQIIPVKP